MIKFRHLMMLAGIAASALLGACLPEDKDPSVQETRGAGQYETPSYYANGMGNLAVKIQNAVVSDPAWFLSLTNGYELNLASLGITATGMGTPVKSYVCPSASGNSVQQITWLDGRDESGKFGLRGMGTDAGTIVGALRNRVAGNQVGVYKGENKISLADGSTFSVSGSCANMSIPQGAPLIVYTIERPAAPTTELARTEYKTQDCGVDSSGRERRGTMVQKRVMRYKPDGTIETGNWETENMGECVDDVVVQITQHEERTGGASADLEKFAAVSLRAVLEQQLKMDCSRSSVQSDAMNKNDVRVKKSKTIDTCDSVSGDGVSTIDDTDAGSGSDGRVIQCAGSTSLALMRFVNLLGNGTSTTSWTAGTATIVRKVLNRDTDGNASDIERKTWVGTDIGCRGHEDFFVACNKIPGAPELKAREENNKWITTDPTNADWGSILEPIVIGGFLGAFGGVVLVGLGAIPVFGWIALGIGVIIGIFFGQTTVTGREATVLNARYFTGIEVVENSGTTTTRQMKADDWKDKFLFEPLTLPNSPWVIKTNQCLWQERVMTAECPNYDPNQQGNWTSAEASGYVPAPTALLPGVAAGGNDSGKIYKELVTHGAPVANVKIHWKKCGLFGCSRWTESAGPGTGAYIVRNTRQENGVTIHDTLLNKDGILLAHQPVIENNTHLTVRQSGFVEPLRCLRNEVKTYTWPLQIRTQNCGIKGCSTSVTNTTTTVTETTSREWSGKSYETGTWSLPKVGFISDYGTWSSLSAIPNPIVINR